MRGKTSKIIRKFAVNSWDETPEAERPSSLKVYQRNLKAEYMRNPDFKKFLKFAIMKFQTDLPE